MKSGFALFIWRAALSWGRFGAMVVGRFIERNGRGVGGLKTDHLVGILYVNRMNSENELIPYDLHKRAGEPWTY